jgi:hypothetical protein
MHARRTFATAPEAEIKPSPLSVRLNLIFFFYYTVTLVTVLIGLHFNSCQR